MVEKDIREGVCHTIYQNAKANNKCIKDYYKNIESSYSNNWEVNDFYVWAMWQNVAVNEFKWVEETWKFNKYIW